MILLAAQNEPRDYLSVIASLNTIQDRTKDQPNGCSNPGLG